MYKLLLLLLLLTSLPPSSSIQYKIGVLYGSNDKDYIAIVNKISQFALSQLPTNSSVTLELITEEYEPTLLATAAAVCSLVKQGVVAVITSGDSDRVAMEMDILVKYNIPLIATSATDSMLKGNYKRSLLLMSPTNFYQVKTVHRILKNFNWYDFSILASSDNYGIHGVTDLVYLTRIINEDINFRILNVQYISNNEESEIEKKLQIIKDSLSKVILLNCPREYGNVVLKIAHQKEMLKEGYVWILTDATVMYPPALSINGSYPSYYTGLMATLPTSVKKEQFQTFKDKYLLEEGGKLDDITIYTQLAYDAVGVVHMALERIVKLKQEFVVPGNLDCGKTEWWESGTTMYDALTNTTTTGVSGLIKFSPNGYSKRRSIDILNFKEDRFEKVGHHNRSLFLEESDVRYLGGKSKAPTALAEDLAGRHLKIGILVNAPLYIKKNFTNCTTGEELKNPYCWTGFCPDLTAKMAEELNFTYEYHINSENKVGGYHKELGRFNGLMYDLINGTIDIIAITLTVNEQRKNVIEFTSPIMVSRSASIVSLRGEHMTKNKFFFLAPFNKEVWCVIVLVGVGFILVLNLFTKLSPYGKYGSKIHALQTCKCEECRERRSLVKSRKCSFLHTRKFDCEIEDAEDEDPLKEISLYDSIWSITSGFVGQGPENVPGNITARFLLFSWWLFMMIMLSLYTANLTAFLTLKRAGLSINTVVDLLDQQELEWGIIPDRITESRLLNHVDDTYRELLERGKRLDDLDAAVARVRDKDFVFLDEQHVLEYNFRDDCEAVYIQNGIQVGEMGYGLRKNSPFENMINKFFLRYREEGFFGSLRAEWYGRNSECKGGGSMGSDTPIGLPALEALFSGLALAVIVSGVLCLLEVLHASLADTMKDTDSSVRGAFGKRVKLKLKDITREWLTIGTPPPYTEAPQNGHGGKDEQDSAI